MSVPNNVFFKLWEQDAAVIGVKSALQFENDDLDHRGVKTFLIFKKNN